MESAVHKSHLSRVRFNRGTPLVFKVLDQVQQDPSESEAEKYFERLTRNRKLSILPEF